MYKTENSQTPEGKISVLWRGLSESENNRNLTRGFWDFSVLYVFSGVWFCFSLFTVKNAQITMKSPFVVARDVMITMTSQCLISPVGETRKSQPDNWNFLVQKVRNIESNTTGRKREKSQTPKFRFLLQASSGNNRNLARGFWDFEVLYFFSDVWFCFSLYNINYPNDNKIGIFCCTLKMEQLMSQCLVS